MDISIAQWIGGTIENLLNSFVLDGVTNLSMSIAPLVVVGVTIHIMTQAYLQIFGKTDDLVVDTVIHCLTVICITTLTLNAGNYTEYVVGTVEALATGLAGSILPYDENQNVYQVVDALIGQSIDYCMTCWDQISGLNEHTFPWFFAGVIVVGAVFILAAKSVIIIIGTKFMLAMLLVMGPIFITLAIFPATRKFVDSWLGEVFKNLLVQIFGVAVIYVVISIMDNSLNQVLLDKEISPLPIGVQIGFVATILSFVITQIPSLAGALSGGFASAMMKLPKIGKPAPDARPDDSPDRVGNRDTWQQQQQNQIRPSAPKHDLSRDLKDRIAAHNQKVQ